MTRQSKRSTVIESWSRTNRVGISRGERSSPARMETIQWSDRDACGRRCGLLLRARVHQRRSHCDGRSSQRSQSDLRQAGQRLPIPAEDDEQLSREAYALWGTTDYWGQPQYVPGLLQTTAPSRKCSILLSRHPVTAANNPHSRCGSPGPRMRGATSAYARTSPIAGRLVGEGASRKALDHGDLAPEV